jgi:hypothetical protein
MSQAEWREYLRREQALRQLQKSARRPSPEELFSPEERKELASLKARIRRMQELRKAIRDATGGLVHPETADPSLISIPALRRAVEEYQDLQRKMGVPQRRGWSSSQPKATERKPAPEPPADGGSTRGGEASAGEPKRYDGLPTE